MTTSRPIDPREHASGGFIVVAVLWILGALATLATVYSVYVIDTAVAFSAHDERLQAKAMVTAGVELAAYQLSFPAEVRPPRHGFAFRLGRANVTVAYRSEGARIDLNAAPKELLSGLFAVLGARRSDADTYADRIIGWRNPPGDQDDEGPAYRTGGIPYAPRGGRFPHVNELSLVMGLPEFLVERALPYFTVYSDRPEIDVMEAAPEVLAALPGMTPDVLRAVLVQRAATPQNGQLVTTLLAGQTIATTEPSKAWRISVQVVFDNGRRVNSEVVILMIDAGSDPYRVLSWRDLLDEIADERPRPVVR